MDFSGSLLQIYISFTWVIINASQRLGPESIGLGWGPDLGSFSNLSDDGDMQLRISGLDTQ